MFPERKPNSLKLSSYFLCFLWIAMQKKSPRYIASVSVRRISYRLLRAEATIFAAAISMRTAPSANITPHKRPSNRIMAILSGNRNPPNNAVKMASLFPRNVSTAVSLSGQNRNATNPASIPMVALTNMMIPSRELVSAGESPNSGSIGYKSCSNIVIVLFPFS